MGVSLGEQQVKGFDDPVRIYRISLKSGESVPAPEEGIHDAPAATRWKAIASIAAVAVLLSAGAWWWQPGNSTPEPVPEQSDKPLTDKPSIVVLPFDNMSSDPEQEYFADGITEDITTHLSKIRELFVISRNSAFTYRGKTSGQNRWPTTWVYAIYWREAFGAPPTRYESTLS